SFETTSMSARRRVNFDRNGARRRLLRQRRGVVSLSATTVERALVQGVVGPFRLEEKTDVTTAGEFEQHDDRRGTRVWNRHLLAHLGGDDPTDNPMVGPHGCSATRTLGSHAVRLEARSVPESAISLTS